MFDYGSILGCLEEIIESIDFDDTTLVEIKSKLQDLISEIEENLDPSDNGWSEFGFDDLD